MINRIVFVSWLAIGAALALFAIYRLRIRALHQRSRAVVEERLRIAREIHDTLAQGFSGLTYQLEGLSQELNGSASRAALKRHLDLALQLVRHSREEAHRSIFALRSLAHVSPDLLTLLVTSSEAMISDRDIRLVAVKSGRPEHIADEVLSSLVRIGLEAIANTLQHSGASEISVMVRYSAAVILEVRDNGCGFDAGSIRSVDAGHFGIAGMRERAERINASFTIRSGSEGTTVTVRAGTLRESLREKLRFFQARSRECA
jgi:signal transduction histidine kinase